MKVRVCLMLIALTVLLTGCGLRPPDIMGRWSGMSEGQLVRLYITPEFITQQIGSNNQVWRYTLGRGSITFYTPYTNKQWSAACVLYGDALIIDNLYLHKEE